MKKIKALPQREQRNKSIIPLSQEDTKRSYEQYDLMFHESLEGIFFMMMDEPLEWNDTTDKEAALDYAFVHQKITKANQALLEQYHASQEQVLGLTPAALTAEDPVAGRKSWRDFFDSGYLYIYQDTKRFDGTPLYIEGYYRCLYDDQNRILGHFGIQRDISEERQNQQTLKMFEQTFRGYTDGINISDLDDKILYVNPAFCKMYGYTEDELIGQKSHIFRSDKNDPELVSTIFPSTLNGGWKGELINMRKDGSEFPIYLTTSLILNDENEKIAVVAIAEDTTKRKREEAEKRAITEIINGVTSTSNLDELLRLIHSSLGKVIYAENIFIALYNEITELFSFPYYVDKFDPVPPPLSLKKSCTAYVFKKGVPLLLSADRFEELLNQGEVELVGTNSPSWIGLPLKVPERTIGVLVLQNYEQYNVYTDDDIRFLNSIGGQISLAIERKITEEELNESDEVFRRLFFESKDPILLLNETGFTDCNPAAVQILRYPNKEELVESKPWDISPKYQPDGRLSQEKANEMIEIALETGYNRFEWIHLTYDKNEIPVEVVLTPIQVKGRQYLYTLWRDISERKKSELEIKQKNEQLKELIATREKFFAIIAHDLKSPFQGLLGLTQIISENPENFTLKELSEITHGLHQTTSNLLNLLKNLLDWAQVQRGSICYTPAHISLTEIIEANVSLLRKRAKEKEIALTYSGKQPIHIYADSNMVNSIIINLLTNAIKFTGHGGKVTIKAAIKGPEQVLVSVNDTGIGIPREMAEKVFQIGEKVKRKGTDGELSTGLGLILCKEFVELNGGSIWVESKEGKGSKFCFTLPFESK